MKCVSGFAENFSSRGKYPPILGYISGYIGFVEGINLYVVENP
jgi:hypothetical protein